MRRISSVSSPCKRVVMSRVFSSVLPDVEVLEEVGRPVRVTGYDAEPVTKVLLLHVSFGEVLDVALGHGLDGVDGHAGGITRHLDKVTEVVGLAIDLDMVHKVFLILNNVEDVVTNGVLAVNHKLEVDLLLRLLAGSHG